MSTDERKIRMLAHAGSMRFGSHVPLASGPGGNSSCRAAPVSHGRSPDGRVEIPLIPEREADLVRLIEWAEAEGLAS